MFLLNSISSFCKISGIQQKSRLIKIMAFRFFLITSFICAFWASNQVQAETIERVPVFLSDLSQTYPPLSMAKLLIDAKRRSFSVGKPIYQCDSSVAEPHNTPISIKGKRYEKGIGTGTPFILTFELAGAYNSFSTVAGIDDAEANPEDWVLEVYLDDVKAGAWTATKNKPATVNVDTTGVQELVLVGSGRDLMLVDLAGACVVPSSELPKPVKINQTNRQAIFKLDDKLIMDCEVLLMARTAKKIDSSTGPDQLALGLGGYGRTTSTRGADTWVGIKDKGDLLLWQAFFRKPGNYQVWVRVVSSAPGEKPKPEDYIIRVDGKIISSSLASQMIIERMTDERFTNHLWGYLCFDIPLDFGIHDVEIENASGKFLAVNRVVFIRQGTITESLKPRPVLEPIATKQEITVSSRWEPKKLVGEHFVSVDIGEPFVAARELGLMFAPTLWQKALHIGDISKETIQQVISSNLPFNIHARFSEPIESPVIDEETYNYIKDAACERWQGFWTTEWSDCYLASQEANSSPKPKNRKEAYQRVKSWYQQKASMCYNHILPMDASVNWSHYAGEWSGATGFQCEPGIASENQFNMLFTRGAARQYGKIWHCYFAPGAHGAHCWIQNYYGVTPHLGWTYNNSTLHNPHGGSSISWVKRMMYLTYMWGVTSLTNETPSYQTDMTGDGSIALSPMGKVADEFFKFAATHKNRGICYTPIGIMLDFMHGWVGNIIYPDLYPKLTWGCLEPDASDYMKDAIFEVIYPGQYDVFNEWSILSSTPYGDLFDVMLSSAGPEHIQTYPVLMLVGDLAVDMNDILAANLETYVRNGGTLVINTKQIAPSFPEELLGVKITEKINQTDIAKCNLDDCEINGQTFSYRTVELTTAKPIISTSDNKPLVTRNEVGKGVVILTTVPFLLQENLNGVCFLPHLMEHLTSGLLPFRVDGDIEYAANRNKDSWLVTLINNRGIYKLPTESTIVDQRQIQKVYITMNNNPTKLADWITGEELRANKTGKEWQITVDIPPGDLKIIQIQD